MAIRKTHLVGTGLLLLWSAACNREPDARQLATQDAVAPDACDVVRLSQDQLVQTTSDAKRGDVSAQDRLWGHYLCTDQPKAAYWQDRLIEQNDWNAMQTRAETLFSHALDLSDSDPRKPTLLQTAQDLEARARKARGRGVETVFVNGKDVAVPFSDEPNDFTKRLQNELDRLPKR